MPVKCNLRRYAVGGKKGGGGGGAAGEGVDSSSSGGGDALLKCSMCRLVFTSGNALHKHLKEAHSGTHKKKR